MVLGIVAVTDGLIILTGDDDGGAHAAGVDADGRPIIQIDFKAPSKRPELKPSAMAPTVAGATAFSLFWFDALNYSLAHGDSDLLAHHSNAGCGLCTGYLMAIQSWKQKGVQETGGYTVPAALAIGPFSTTDPVTFAATFITSPATLRQPDGSVAEYGGGRTRGSFTVLYANGRWQMTDVVLDLTKAKEATP
jgi:hypothetical protein